MIDASPQFYCMWSDFRRIVCRKPATHGTLLGDGTYYLCPSHARRARADGWRGVKPLKKAKS